MWTDFWGFIFSFFICVSFLCVFFLFLFLFQLQCMFSVTLYGFQVTSIVVRYFFCFWSVSMRSILSFPEMHTVRVECRPIPAVQSVGHSEFGSCASWSRTCRSRSLNLTKPRFPPHGRASSLLQVFMQSGFRLRILSRWYLVPRDSHLFNIVFYRTRPPPPEGQR